MKRRLMAVLMACVMTLSLLPISALATDSGMEFYKTARDNENGTYTISMEAWATGKTTTSTTTVPLDIALVLDVSGSMDDPFAGTYQKKIDALKTAVNGFIEGVAAKSPDSNISIVKFAGDKANWVGNDTYRDGRYRYNYSQIVRNLTPAGTGMSDLKAAVSSLKAAGATSADYGMQLANTALQSATNQKVVVMFTDGVPTHERDFDYSVAAEVVNTARSMKAGGTTIYTVGVFDSTNDQDINTYMSSTSSNYPTASAEVEKDWFWGTTGWNVTAGGSNYGKYYKTAANAADLNNIFETISQDIYSAANPELNDTTTVVDTLSEYFTFADTNPVSSVKVYTADWNGNSWNEKVEAPANVTASVEGKTVRVTGYNYAEHYVHGTEGQKLIIEITVVPDPTATWGPTNEYPTNQGNAAVMLSEQVIEERPSPTVRVATYQVMYQVNGDAPDNTTYEDPKYYISGQQATVLPKPSNCEKDGYSYTFDGWRLDEAEAPAVLTMTDDVTLTGTWTKAPISYNITYDLDSGALAEGEENPATYTVDTETFTLHNPTRENYTFTGWTGTGLSGETEQVTVTKGSTGDRAYKANWELTTFADEIVVTIKGDTGSEEYNGSEQSVTGYTMEITQNNAEHPYSLDYVEGPAQTTAIAEGTNVGKHSMGLKAEDFKNSNLQYPNVTFIVEDGYLEITPKPATITVASAEKSFGAPDPKFTGTVKGLVKDGDLGEISYSRTNTDEAVGTYSEVLDANYTANENYSVNVVKGDFTIETATSDAKLSAAGGEWEYDGKAHAASATVSDETFTIYYKAGDGEWTATAPSVTNVSDGLVTVSVKATKDGYNDLTCGDVTLKITPRPATITVDPAEKFFGEKDPAFTGKVEGLVKDGDLGKISYSRTNTDEAVGTYEGVLDATYTANSNYTVKVVKGNFTIKTAASDATLSAAGGEWEYDGKAHAASATVSDETFTIYYKAGDGEWTATAPSVTNVSDGLVTVSVKATKDGYNDLTCDDVTLKITPKPVTITVDSAEKTFGKPDPAFTGTEEGLIGKNDLGKISYSRTNKDEAVGTYEGVLDATYTENKNYTVKVVKGNFTIKTAASDATLSAAGGEWEYDGKAHAASATVSDETFTIYYKAGDGEWTATAPSVTNVSDGLVTVSVKATKDGYNDLTCDNVTLKITPKPVTVTANDMYVFSGSPVPTYSAQVEGTINDDKITYTISCDYTETAGAGEFFDIVPSGEAEQGNYVVTYVNGTLEVRQLPNLAFNLGQYIQKDLRIIGSRAFTGATYSATVTPVVNNELGKAMTITVSYGSGESGLKPFVGELGFTERGSYRYEVKEIIPSGATGYDTSVYYLTVDVGLNDDELVVDKVTKTLAGGSEDPSEGAIVFCNTYNTGTIYVPVVKPALNRDDHYAYVVGYPDGMVRPSGNITRAEAATIFFRLLTDDSRNQFWMTTNTYSDVNRGDWFNNAVSTLSNAGIISGYPDGTFRPNAPITRAEMSKIIALFAKLNKSEDRFNDIAGHWAEAYIKLAAGNGWIAGYPDGSFKPQQNITRAETMTMINRVLERVPSVESHLLPYNAMLTFPDCQSGQWFYIAVQEATNSHTYERAASEKNGDEQWIALRANRDWTQFQN